MPRASSLSSERSYIQSLFAQENDVLHHVHKACELHSPGMHIAREEGKFLSLLVALTHAKNIVEIGTFLGYSTLWMAQALEKEGVIHTIERNPIWHEKACAHFALSSKNPFIRPHLGDAKDILIALEKQAPFDMVFIDANKNQTLHHVLWAEKNLKPKGIIIVDNSLLSGSVYQDTPSSPRREKAWKAMREANMYLAREEKFCSLLFPMCDGMTVAMKR